MSSNSANMLSTPTSSINLPATLHLEPDHTPHHSQLARAENAKNSCNAASTGNQLSVTVKSVIPNPTNCFINPDGVIGFSDVLLRQVPCFITFLLSHRPRCVQALSNYVNAAAKTYALGCLPTNVTWGKYDPYNDWSKDLCIPTTNERIHIWIVGHITSLWFMKNGASDNQCSMTVLPLSNTLGIQANQLISGLSSPVTHMCFFGPPPIPRTHHCPFHISVDIIHSWCYPSRSLANSQRWWRCLYPSLYHTFCTLKLSSSLGNLV